MPYYEYKCHACNQVFEAQHSMMAEPLKTCELCKTGPVEKLISKPNFHLAGDGWFRDGYSSKPKENKPETKPGKKKEEK